MTAGTLYGLGVGPGDPELMTLKAVRLLATAPVVAYPAPNGEASLARKIAKAHLPAGAVEIAVDLPMSTERAPARAAYQAAAQEIAGHLDQGRDVAFLCEGDPFFYGSFMYLFALLAGRYPAEVVPGVTSLTACAAAIRRPLAARNEVLKILPAPLSEARLEAELKSAEAAAIVKVGRHFDKVRGVLRRLGLAERAAIVEAATRDDERVRPLEAIPEGDRPYFSTILVYAGEEGW